MDVRQVFIESYANTTTGNGSRDYGFCPKCGKYLGRLEEQGIMRSCGFVQYRNPAPVVVVIVERENQILLGKRRSTASYKPGFWCLPGGYIEFGESYLDAAHREVKEETGLNIEIQSIVNVVSNFLTEKLQTLAIVLSATPISDTLKPGDDIDEVGWYSLHQQLPIMSTESEEYMIKQYATQSQKGLPIDPKGRLKNSWDHV